MKKDFFEVGDVVKFDTSSYSRAYPQKRKHLKVCKIIEIYSAPLTNMGEAIWEDGYTGTVCLEYLKHTSDNFTLEQKQQNLFEVA